jgi:transposase-like protein
MTLANYIQLLGGRDKARAGLISMLSLHGNQSAAARAIGVSRNSIGSWIRQLGITRVEATFN